LGIMDVTITKPTGVGQAGAIIYRADPNESTTSDISIGRPNRVGKKKGRAKSAPEGTYKSMKEIVFG